MRKSLRASRNEDRVIGTRNGNDADFLLSPDARAPASQLLSLINNEDFHMWIHTREGERERESWREGGREEEREERREARMDEGKREHSPSASGGCLG